MSRANTLPSTRSASSFFPSPRAMEKMVAPPVPKRLVKAAMSTMTGKVTPKPDSAISPTSSRCPMKMRSTTLYKS